MALDYVTASVRHGMRVWLACLALSVAGAALTCDGTGASHRASRLEHAPAPPRVAPRVAPREESPERYERKRWPHWIDADGDCQNTRHELLIATSLGPVTFKDRRPCQVVRGTWRDAYTGKLITNASKLDADHVVPLAEAYRSGGSSWTEHRRRAFANDLDGLVLTRRNINRTKADQDPATWLPPNPALRCDYVRRWLTIKRSWQLTIDVRELDAIRSACPEAIE